MSIKNVQPFRTCTQLESVIDVAKGIQDKTEFQEVLTSVPKIQDKLMKMQEQKQDNINQLRQASEDIKSAIKALRKEINSILDVLEQKTEKELGLLLANMEKTLQTDKEACCVLQNKIKTIHLNMKTKGISGESVVFRSFKKCKEKSKEANEFLQFLKSAQNSTITFTPNKDIESFLSALDALGKIASYCGLATGSTSSKNTSIAPTRPVARGAHIHIEHIQTYNVKIWSDTVVCKITGACLLPNGNCVVTDLANETVKLLNDTFTVIDGFELLGYQSDVCHVNDGEVAVVVWDWFGKHDLEFISTTKGKLNRTRTVRLDHHCSCITAHGGRLYIGSDCGLCVYTTDCEMVKTLYKEYVGHVAVSDDGTRIYITNSESLLTLDHTGKELSTLNYTDLQGTAGVTVTGRGNVFVCGTKSNAVLQVESKGNEAFTVATYKDKVVAPQALCFNRSTSELIVGQNSDNILVIKLK